MQYSVRGSDGKLYGPVDLQTIQSWIAEGRVVGSTEVVDQLSNRTAPAAEFTEFGIGSASPAEAPPAHYSAYPRAQAQPAANVKVRTRLWGIVGWTVLAVIVSFFFSFWPIWICGWNIVDGFRARAARDPQAPACMAVAVGGFMVITLWSLIKYKIGAW
ncbi:MAG: hypothetical protein GC165_13180 [Armatimonadetes bacterium]|nr:hypothetical protein [Armatimonadota bacterium]MBS1725978.1 hypothetical protein [Armatimonadota bacterium]